MIEKNLIIMARRLGYSEQEFRKEISSIYASINDLDLDDVPDMKIKKEITFKNYKLVIEIYREFFN